MSDEGLINVEDDAPTPVEALTPQEPASDAAPDDQTPPVEAQDRPATVDAVEVGGQQYAPIAALKAEREKRQALEPLARRAQELEAWQQQNAPYIEFLRANPDFLRQQQRQPDPVPAPSTPQVDPAAIELAQSLDLYDQHGNPDVARAAKIQAVMAKTAETQARQLVQPFEDQRVQAKAVEGYQYLASLKHADGTPIDRQVVDFIWQQASQEPNGMQTLGNPQSVAGLALMALGADAQWKGRSKSAAPAKPAPPVFTEGSGGNPRSAPTVSAMEERVAKERGMTAAAWSENLRGFKPGATNVLED